MTMTKDTCWNCKTPLEDNIMVSNNTGAVYCKRCCCLVTSFTRLQAIMEIRRLTHEHIEGRMDFDEKENRIRDILTRAPELPLEITR